ncbi:MAG: glycosyltransferase [Aphanocapsa sp. GSE-SYN-MK-11-07L]|jgi:MGT family glycosyltransferase|nr:glycosyltransferase [Aphanocapsa sp. GSE-SYN-MK-11-07L]
MSRIVVTTIGSLGDLHPKIVIALELRKRGHDVVFATHQEYQAQVESLGFEFHRLRPDYPLNDSQEAARMMDLRTGSKYVIHWVSARLRETYTDLVETVKDADFILAGELVYAARLVAETLKIPWALSILQPTSFFSAYDPPVRAEYPVLAKLRVLGPGFNRGLVQFAKWVSQSWAQPIYQFRSELGLPPLAGNPLIDDKHSPYLVLALFSSAFAKPQPDWAINTVQTGFAFYDGSEEEAKLTPKLLQFLEAGEPPIVFTLGSAAVMTPGRFYEESVEAAKHLGCRAVLLVGKNALPQNLPESIIAASYAPYSQIFPRAFAIVHQGGIGTTAQALRAGRPTLVMPYSHDQPDNAARVERLGVSRTIPRKQYSAVRVVRQLRELFENPSYATSAADIGRIIQKENGVELACDAIEKQLQAVSVSS